jgi:hypothetical protein
MERYTHPVPLAVPVWEGQPSFARADLILDGVGHRGDSYEGRIFLNAADADIQTARAPASGYAGSFHVFGHGRCYGDEGHCEIPTGPIHPFDYRRPHPLTLQVHVVRITDALRHLIDAGEREVSITIVPATPKGEPAGDVLFLDRLTLVTYD